MVLQLFAFVENSKKYFVKKLLWILYIAESIRNIISIIAATDLTIKKNNFYRLFVYDSYVY